MGVTWASGPRRNDGTPTCRGVLLSPGRRRPPLPAEICHGRRGGEGRRYLDALARIWGRK